MAGFCCRLSFHLPSPSFAGAGNPRSSLALPPKSSRPPPLFLPRCASAASILPTTNPEVVAGSRAVRWTVRVIKTFSIAELEAKKIKYPETGTESLLMGMLVEGTSLAAQFLRSNGIKIFQLREEIVNLLGKADLCYISDERPPLTEPAQKALNMAIDEQLKSGENGEVTTTHLLLGIWSIKESAGYRLLSSFGIDDEKINNLAKTASKDFEITFR